MPILSALGVTEYENKRKTQAKHNIQQMTFYLKNDLNILFQESLCSCMFKLMRYQRNEECLRKTPLF